MSIVAEWFCFIGIARLLTFHHSFAALRPIAQISLQGEGQVSVNPPSRQCVRDVPCVSAAFWAAYLISAILVCECDAAERTTFPLSKFDDAVTVPVTIDDKQHLFVIDSGSNVHAFHTSLRPHLDNPLGKRTGTAANGEEFEFEIFESPVLKIGVLSLARTMPIACSDLSSIRGASGLDIVGILGVPLFTEYTIQFDFDRGLAEVMPISTKPTVEWGQSVEVLGAKGLPLITLRLADLGDEECIVDLGYTGSIGLRREPFSYLAENQLIVLGEDRESALATGVRTTRGGKLSSIEIAGFKIHGLRASELGRDSRVGLGFLRRFRVTFQLSEGRIYLAKGAEFDRPEREPLVGIGLFHNEGKNVVRSIRPNSPAESAGILVNDELTSVAGKATKNRSLGEVAWTLREMIDENGNISVGIRREGEERVVTVHIDQ